jgi:protein-disulfide isomerase/uncharacterized membrane protein
MTRTHRLLFWLFTLLGLGASATSAWVHHQLLTQPSFTSFCDVNETVNCANAYLSPYGYLFGVPVAVFGVLWFVLVAALLLAARPGSAIEANVPGYLLALTTLGLGVILYLAYGAFFVLGTVCLLCLTTYVAVIGLFLVASAATSFPMSTLPARAWRDLRAAARSPITVVSMLLIGAGAVSAVTTFPKGAVPSSPGLATTAASAAGGSAEAASAAAGAQAAAASTTGLTPQQQAELEKWYSSQPKQIVPVDGGGAAVVIVKFNDFQCPPCRQTYYDYKPILEKYAKQAPGKVKYVSKHYPIDPECNVHTPTGSHMASCEAAAAMVMAGSGAKADALESWLFGNQSTLTGASVRTATRDLAGIPDFDARYPKALDAVKADIALGQLLQVGATPTFFVNGTQIRGGVPAPYFDAIVALELKKAGL